MKTKITVLAKNRYDWESSRDIEEDISWEIVKLKRAKTEEFKGTVTVTIEYEEEE